MQDINKNFWRTDIFQEIFIMDKQWSVHAVEICFSYQSMKWQENEKQDASKEINTVT